MFLTIITTVTSLLLTGVFAAYDCDYRKDILPGQSFNVYSPNFPNNYPGGIQCRYVAVTTSGSTFTLTCKDFSLPKSDDCQEDQFLVSLTGNMDLTDAHKYCGIGSFTVKSTGNQMVMALKAPYYSGGGRFNCSIVASSPSTPPPQTCDCGWKKQSRIVNGHETGINEFPMMAGVIDIQNRDLICGCTIINNRYVLTAAHCLLNRATGNTGVLVGDHDISTGTETNTAQLLQVQSFISHPQYDSVKQLNDIAVIRTLTQITYRLEIGPACLPFRFSNIAVGSVVDLLGWGTLEQAGPKSNTLQETEVDIVNLANCQSVFGSKVTSNQICTYRNGTDACQADSGGPVLWSGPGNRLQQVGIISYGKGCANANPGVNTKVYAYIDWILSVTPDAQYCVR